MNGWFSQVFKFKIRRVVFSLLQCYVYKWIDRKIPYGVVVITASLTVETKFLRTPIHRAWKLVLRVLHFYIILLLLFIRWIVLWNCREMTKTTVSTNWFMWKPRFTVHKFFGKICFSQFSGLLFMDLIYFVCVTSVFRVRPVLQIFSYLPCVIWVPK